MIKMVSRSKQKGLSLPGVLGVNLILFLLAMTLHGHLRQNRLQLADEKHRMAAEWLSISGADLVEARLQKQQLEIGQKFDSPNFQQGRFSVSIEQRGTQIVLVSTGLAGRRTHTTVRAVNPQ